MNYLLLLVIYGILPPIALAYAAKNIFISKDKYGWHYNYLFKYLITFSFLPLLFLPELDLGIYPQRFLSIILFFSVMFLTVFGLSYAKKKKMVFIYIGGSLAAFMEEILFRGVLFGLANIIFNNVWISLVITSILFGIWHLKNIYWHDKKSVIYQFFYTALYAGPLFGLLRILTGDIYLSIFAHYAMNSIVVFAPDWTRGWLVLGGREKNDKDDFDK